MPRWSHLATILVAAAALACGGARPTATPAEPAAPVAAPTPPSSPAPSSTPPSSTAAAAAAPATAKPVVVVTSLPARPLIERRAHGQRVHFDLVFRNDGPVAARLVRLQLSVRDRGGRLIGRRFLDTNGFQPSLSAVGPTTVAPGQTISLFNPLPDYDPELELGSFDYELVFNAENGSKDPPDTTVAISVVPEVFTARSALTLPLAGRVLVFDGHDTHGHHRRLDLNHPMVHGLGIRRNFMRYANDFVIVDDAGAMFRGDGSRNEDWFVFGAPLRSPAAGVVVAVENGIPDNLRDKNLWDPSTITADVMNLYGNRVVIDHGRGEVSVLAHLKQGSVPVKIGDRVVAGQRVGQAGASGDAYIPHLHYELRTGPGVDADGLPAYFRGLRRVVGARTIAVASGPIDSGEIVVSR